MRESCKRYILTFLKDKPNGLAGGIIEDYIRENYGYKASNASRRCRDLVAEGKLLYAYKNGFVYYKIKN
jgi:hypothetical protein